MATGFEATARYSIIFQLPGGCQVGVGLTEEKYEESSGGKPTTKKRKKCENTARPLQHLMAHFIKGRTG